jgi:hypothetical protein
MDKTKKKRILELIFFKIIPLCISITALIFSFFAFGIKQKEDVKVSVKREYSNYKTDIIKIENDPKNPAMLKVKFNVLLINNSERTVSISEYEIKEVTDNEIVDYGKNICGIYFKNSNEKAELPFSIASGQSKKLRIILGLKIAQNPFEILKKKLKNLSDNSTQDIYKILLDNKTDIYGNELQLMFQNDSAIAYKFYYENLKKQNLILSIKTLRNNTFTTTFGYY